MLQWAKIEKTSKRLSVWLRLLTKSTELQMVHLANITCYVSWCISMCKRRRAHIQKRNLWPILPSLMQYDMLRKPHIQKKRFVSWHIWRFLLNDTGGRSVEEKMTKYYLGKESQKYYYKITFVYFFVNVDSNRAFGKRKSFWQLLENFIGNIVLWNIEWWSF